MFIANLLVRMPLSAPILAVSSARNPVSIWKQIEQGVRESCVMRCEGREAEAAVMLQETLPALIREWSATCGSPAEVCRNELRELFARAQEQVAAAMLSRRLVLASIRTDNIRAGASGTLYLRRRVPIDDVPDMLDALDEAERMAASRWQKFSAPMSRSLTAGAAA
jgi:hypothetical protein